ncbi:hypothetical protein FWH58_03235 [Candidatus Saccharibacteria bacterium]|nr:hypothetical protein [Candidatus Saccharibacteria bacterium]
MKTVKKSASARLLGGLSILTAAPAIAGAVYFINNIVTALNSTMFSEKFEMASLGVFFGGILLSAICGSVMNFITDITAHYSGSVKPNKVANTANYAAAIIKMVFVATFGTFWSIGIVLFTLLGAEDVDIDINVALFFSGIGACAACYGYLIHGILSLRKQPAAARRAETICAVIFTLAWIGFSSIMGALTIEETVMRPTYARITYTDSEILAIYIFLFGPLVYLAQKYLLRLILWLIKKKWAKDSRS